MRMCVHTLAPIHPCTHTLRRVLSQKVFTKYRKDHCMCTTCLRSGWRGIYDNGRKVVKMLDALNIWPVTAQKDGSQVRHCPGTHLSARLKRLFVFIRLQLHLHFEEQSGMAAHCLRLHLGSLAEPRFNQPCTHKHRNPKVHQPVPQVRLKHQQSAALSLPSNARTRRTMTDLLTPTDRVVLSSTCTKYRCDWSQDGPGSEWYGSAPPPMCPLRSDTCCNVECKKRASSHCKHCATSFCRKHCEEHLCNAEYLPATFGNTFVCTECAPNVDACQHSAKGCATCDEIAYFKDDLMKCAHVSGCDDILGRARDVCESIDIMVGHTARTTNQERYWPELLVKLRSSKEYDHVLLKSDYWKKFEGTVMKQGTHPPTNHGSTHKHFTSTHHTHLQGNVRLHPSSPSKPTVRGI